MNEKIMIVDVEALSLQKPIIYDIGYTILELRNEKENAILDYGSKIIKQVYDNAILFNSAYYKSKRKLYVKALKGKVAKRVYFGNALRTIKALIKKHNISRVFAYNAEFDEKAFIYSSKFFEKENPFTNLQWIDIMALANKYIHNTEDFKKWALENGFTSPKGYLKTSAEITYKYLFGKDFKEDHLGLNDALLETDIVNRMLGTYNAELTEEKKLFLRA